MFLFLAILLKTKSEKSLGPSSWVSTNNPFTQKMNTQGGAVGWYRRYFLWRVGNYYSLITRVKTLTTPFQAHFKSLVGIFEEQYPGMPVAKMAPNGGQYHMLERLLLFDEYKCTEHEPSTRVLLQPASEWIDKPLFVLRWTMVGIAQTVPNLVTNKYGNPCPKEIFQNEFIHILPLQPTSSRI